ncbi:MAG: RNA-guided endonuclease IscB [Clostridium sp.]|uniref:RNA-guided endonuclease IscB n=1 Tax=Clostridium sp. TaxID=1506 RepID=UPI003D6D2E6C
MSVFVINQRSGPLMPCSPRKARLLLRQGKAKIVKRTPFTIQLLQATGETKQEIILGVDAGSKCIGLSAVTQKKEIFSAEIELRNDIVNLLSTRRQNRRTRRNRLRYRKPRFLNRVGSKSKGWLAPSIENKIDTHLKIVNRIHKLLPISKIIVEVASFDIQKIKNPTIESKEYQEGNGLGFWNVREYVFFRDGHKCRGRKGCNNKILNVHHIESRKVGGSSQENLITLCEDCHNDYHKGKLKLNLKRGKSFRDAAFMGIMRWAFYNKIKKLYSNVSLTYGYITKNTRITNNFPKEHRVDALCITSNPLVKRLQDYYYIKQVRRHNRQIHKANILKGGIKKLNQAPYLVKGFRLFDKVQFEGMECFIFGRRTTGYFDLRRLDGTKVHRSASFKKLNILEIRKNLLWERR